MNVITSIVAAFGFAFIFTKLDVPAGAMLGAMIGVACHNVVIATATRIPNNIEFVSYVVLGWVIGQSFTTETIRTLRGSLVPITLILVGLLVSTALLTVLMNRLGMLDNITAFLSASPGALSSMAAISNATGGDTAVIVTVHTVRVIVILSLAPLVAKLLS